MGVIAGVKHTLSGDGGSHDDVGEVLAASFGSRTSINCFPEVLELMASGAITYPKVATKFSRWGASQVFADLTENPALVQKAMLMMEDSVSVKVKVSEFEHKHEERPSCFIRSSCHPLSP